MKYGIVITIYLESTGIDIEAVLLFSLTQWSRRRL